MAIKPVKTENLTPLQETYRRFWARFNHISSCDDRFVQNFKVHKIASIRYYQDYSVGKPYQICIMISFNKGHASIQAYFSNLVAFDFYLSHRDRIESKIGKRLVWKEMQTKAYAQLNVNITHPITDESKWDAVCNDIIPYAILMKTVFGEL